MEAVLNIFPFKPKGRKRLMLFRLYFVITILVLHKIVQTNKSESSNALNRALELDKGDGV